MAEQQQQLHTSLRYLRLQHDFKTMIKTGIDCVDEETFTALFQGRAAPHQIKHTWKLLQQQSESVVQEACAEFEVACSEVNLQQQLEELEALILQRGLLGTGDSADAPAAALPSSVEAAARMAAKRAEKQQLMATLQELTSRQQQMQTELTAKQQQAGELVRDFKAVEDQLDKVYRAGQQWLQQADGSKG